MNASSASWWHRRSWFSTQLRTVHCKLDSVVVRLLQFRDLGCRCMQLTDEVDMHVMEQLWRTHDDKTRRCVAETSSDCKHTHLPVSFASGTTMEAVCRREYYGIVVLLTTPNGHACLRMHRLNGRCAATPIDILTGHNGKRCRQGRRPRWLWPARGGCIPWPIASVRRSSFREWEAMY